MDLSFLISIGYMFLLISYIVTNIVWYRVINIFGCVFVVLWGGLTANGSNLIQIVVWNSLFALIQFINLIKLFCANNTIAKSMDEPISQQEIVVLG
jgi:hypothetical protein